MIDSVTLVQDVAIDNEKFTLGYIVYKDSTGGNKWIKSISWDSKGDPEEGFSKRLKLTNLLSDGLVEDCRGSI